MCKRGGNLNDQVGAVPVVAVVDSNYRFVQFGVGGDAQVGDAELFTCTDLGVALRDGAANLPPSADLPGYDSGPLPYVFLAENVDIGFDENILLPYPELSEDDRLTPQQMSFNRRLKKYSRFKHFLIYRSLSELFCSIFRAYADIDMIIKYATLVCY